MQFKKWLSVVILLAVGACSTVPTPRDVTGLSSKELTQFVRCEMSNAVRNKLVSLMTERRRLSGQPYISQYDGKNIQFEIEKLKSDPAEFNRLNWSKFDAVASKALPSFAMIVVGYDFTLQGVTDSTLGLTLDLVGKSTKRTTSINNMISIEVEHDNKDHFRVFDSFDVLIRKVRPEDCSGTPRFPNPAYPIAGLLSFDDLVENFFYSLENQNLTALGKDNEFSLLPTFSNGEETRTIVFTTKLIANFDPTSTLVPAHPVLVFAPLTFKSDNMRTDTHTVIVNLRQPASAKDAPFFDEYGRLNSRPLAIQQKGVAASSVALDRAVTINAQDSISQIGRVVNRLGIVP